MAAVAVRAAAERPGPRCGLALAQAQAHRQTREVKNKYKPRQDQAAGQPGLVCAAGEMDTADTARKCRKMKNRYGVLQNLTQKRHEFPK